MVRLRKSLVQQICVNSSARSIALFNSEPHERSGPPAKSLVLTPQSFGIREASVRPGVLEGLAGVQR